MQNTIKKHGSLKAYNTFSIDCYASHLMHITDSEQLPELISLIQQQFPRPLILGEGSNILLTQDIQGLVVKNELTGKFITQEDQDHIWLTISSGESWHELVMYCNAMGYHGIENLALIPGTVGAAPVQNIGAYGTELSDVFDSLRAIQLTTGETLHFSLADCQFDYRHSLFKTAEHKGRYYITDITLKLSKKPCFNLSYHSLQKALAHTPVNTLTQQDISNAVMHIRKTLLPNPDSIPNAGSFFKNPIISRQALSDIQQQHPHISFHTLTDTEVKLSAAWLIDHLNYKGHILNGAGVYPQHALVLINHDQCSGEDIQHLANTIIQDVKDTFAVTLEPEVSIISNQYDSIQDTASI